MDKKSAAAAQTMGFEQALSEIRERSESKAELGAAFERLCAWYLANEPVWAGRVCDVRLWRDFEGAQGRDLGIDIVARDRCDGTLWAVQCKCLGHGATLTYEQTATFFARAKAGGEFSHLLVCDTAAGWSANLQDVAARAGCVRLSAREMGDSSLDFAGFFQGRERGERRVREMRAHQRAAVEACAGGLADGGRGRLVMACGTGKTLVALRLAERVCDGGGLVLFLAPSINLLAQTLAAFSADAVMPLAASVVCSDASASAVEDSWDMAVSEIPFPATTDPGQIAAQVAARQADGTLSAVLCTYQSLSRVCEAQERFGLGQFDLVICDEAHRTTGVAQVAGQGQEGQGQGPGQGAGEGACHAGTRDGDTVSGCQGQGQGPQGRGQSQGQGPRAKLAREGGKTREDGDSHTGRMNSAGDEEKRRRAGREGSGARESGPSVSAFTLVHDETRLSAARRLYMTATPRVYAPAAKRAAAAGDVVLASMDDEETYGPLLYKLTFSRAVEAGLLSDYRVVVLTVSEEAASGAYQRGCAAEGGFTVPETAKVLGCWQALATRGNGNARALLLGAPAGGEARGSGAAAGAAGAPADAAAGPMRRAVAFCSSIEESKRLARRFSGVVEAACEEAAEARLAAGEYQSGTRDAADDAACECQVGTRDAAGIEESACQGGTRDDTSVGARECHDGARDDDAAGDTCRDTCRVDVARQAGTRPAFTVECAHVDGTMPMRQRAELLDWLTEGPDEEAAGGLGSCRLLCNARCLSEGVDVPALDAAVFFSAKRSKVDIVQAVGRVMRKAPGKEYGYIILPVVVPAGVEPEDALDDDAVFGGVWDVLAALRSHDERIDAAAAASALDASTAVVSCLRLEQGQVGGKREKERIGERDKGEATSTSEGGGGKRHHERTNQLAWAFPEAVWRDCMSATLVRRCGNRAYWEDWAADVAGIAERHVAAIETLVDAGGAARAEFGRFLTGLRETINPGLSRQDAVEMLAQHMVTRPIFEALFGNGEAVRANPVSRAMEGVLAALDAGQVTEAADAAKLEAMYASVRARVAQVKTPQGRQAVTKELYEKFFCRAFPRTAERMGIVYTPCEIVGWMLAACEQAMRRHFGGHLADPDVHVLDPFAGTGAFFAQLLADPELMPSASLARNYDCELHANEILPLAYYIMSVNVEAAYLARRPQETSHPFEGAVLADTFQAEEEGNTIDDEVFSANSKRLKEQMREEITVIVGNPPYSAGQRNANDDAANEAYPTLDASIRESYAAQSSATSKKNLYDSYVRAFRWAGRRIREEGMVCFVSNGSWLTGRAHDGMRKCLAEEYSAIYVLDLRGNLRAPAAERAAQGENVFDGACMLPVTVTLLVRERGYEGSAEISYLDIGEGMSREEKLSRLQAMAADPLGADGWRRIVPDAHGDWLEQRDDRFADFAPLGIEKGKAPQGIFEMWSLGIKTARDAWCWNFSGDAVAGNTARLVENTNAETAAMAEEGRSKPASYDAARFSWTRAMLARARRGEELGWDTGRIVRGTYRPFCRKSAYYGGGLNGCTYQMPRVFPLAGAGSCAGNVVICSSERGAFVTDSLPDLNFVGDSQCFPLWVYEEDAGEEGETAGCEGQLALGCGQGEGREEDEVQVLCGDVPPEMAREIARRAEEQRENECQAGTREGTCGLKRHPAIGEQAVAAFRAAYPHVYEGREEKVGGPEIGAEDVFAYVYGILWCPEYRERFSANLARELPRVPLAADFPAFAKAGRRLMELHLGYEDVAGWPGVRVVGDPMGRRVERMRWAKRADEETGKKVNDFTRVVVCDGVEVVGIPEACEQFQVGGKSAIGWVLDRWRVKRDKRTGIVDDCNEAPEAAECGGAASYACGLIARLARVAMESLEAVVGMPELRERGVAELPGEWPASWRG